MKEINSFKCISLKFGENITGKHYLFMKQHKIRGICEHRPSELTLFVCNVPPYFDTKCFENLFENCGKVTNVFFTAINDRKINVAPKDAYVPIPEPKGYKSAFVVFDKPSSLQAALNFELPDGIFPLKNAISLEWCREYNESMVDAAKLKKEVDEYMRKYDEVEKEKNEIEKSLEEPDKEGWTVVTKMGKNAGIARKESVVKNINKNINKKRKRKELHNFYSFQIKESKMKHLLKLQEKYDKDQKKLERLKVARKFKPY